MKQIRNFIKKLYSAGHHDLAASLVEANDSHNKKVLEEWNKTKEGDIYEQLMNEIPMSPENETLDQQVDREIKMDSELGSESDREVLIRALQKRLKSKSVDLSDLLDEVEKSNKLKNKQQPQESEKPILLSQLTDERRYKVSVLYPLVDSNGTPFFDMKDGVHETLSVNEEALQGLKQEESLGYLRVLEVKPKLPKSN